MKLYNSIEHDIQEWAMKQSIFFSASAPLSGRHINVSPKGLPATSFSILGPNLCAYVDATGSGVETIANILENKRVTIMFCSFDTSPRILRFFCTGQVVEWNEPGFDDWLKRMGEKKFVAARAIVVLDVFQVQTSCGFGVPRLALKQDAKDVTKQIPYLADRETLGHWGDKLVTTDTANDYRAKNNSKSLDGLPGLKVARRDNREWLWYGDVKARMHRPNGPIQTIFIAMLSSFLTIISLYALGTVNLSKWTNSRE